MIGVYTNGSGTTELYMFIGKVTYSRYCIQILSDQGTQDSCSCAVQDAYASHTYQDGIIYKIGNCL